LLAQDLSEIGLHFLDHRMVRCMDASNSVAPEVTRSSLRGGEQRGTKWLQLWKFRLNLGHRRVGFSLYLG
jgi:hypothetical protein